MRRLTFLLLMGLSSLYLTAQPYPEVSSCSDILALARTSYLRGEYEKSLQQLQDTETCDNKDLLAAERRKLEKQIFSAINQQRIQAEKDRKAAQEAEQKAQKALYQAGRTARANQNALLALQTDKTDPTLALNIAKLNREIYPESRTATGILSELLADNQGVASMITRKGHTGKINAVRFSPDGQYVLTGSNDKTARLWSLNGKEVQRFSGHTDIVTDVRFSPNGQYVLTGSDDNTARLWSLDGREVQRFSGHKGSIFDVQFSPDGKYALTGSDDKTAR